MQDQTPQYPYISPVFQPIASPQTQINFQVVQYPQITQFQQIPTQNPLEILQNQHLNSCCPVHQNIIRNICKANGCQRRLLCDLCVGEHLKVQANHRDAIILLQDFLHESVLAELDKLSREEVQTFKPLDERYHTVSSAMHAAFDELRIKMQDLINQAEEKAQQKAKEYFQIKQPKGWIYAREEYLAARDAFLHSNPGVQTKELDHFVEIMNKIRIKQLERVNEIHEAMKDQINQMDKFFHRVKENFDLMVNTLFYDERTDSQRLSVKIDPTKIFYHKEFKGEHKIVMNAITYIPKLDQLIVATEAGMLTAWNPTTYACLGQYKVHSDAINAILYVENENLLVTASKDKSVRLVPVTENGINIDKIEMFRSHTEPVRSLVLLEGEDRFASAGEEPDIRIWHFKSKNLDNIINTKGWKTIGDEMTFIRPERWIVAAGKKEIRIYDYVTRELLITQSVWKMMGSIAFLPQKRQLVAQDDDDRIMVWNVDSAKKKLKKEKKINLPVSMKRQAYFKCFESSDVMVLSTGTNKINVFKLSTGELIKEIETKLQNTTCITVLNKERRLIVGDSGSNLIGVFQY